VSLTEKRSGQDVDEDIEVRDLKELYRVCRSTSSSKLVRVSLMGPEGEVRLNFAAFIPLV
jgi:hypothetical protein